MTSMASQLPTQALSGHDNSGLGERRLADEAVKIIHGVAGLIGLLLRSDSPRFLELAQVCGEKLLNLNSKDAAGP
jgi:lantibiotic modifying enzyme